MVFSPKRSLHISEKMQSLPNFLFGLQMSSLRFALPADKDYKPYKNSFALGGIVKREDQEIANNLTYQEHLKMRRTYAHFNKERHCHYNTSNYSFDDERAISIPM